MTTILFGDADEFEHGFQLGATWQMLRAGMDNVDVVIPRSLASRAARLGMATGYRVIIRRVNDGMRFVRFTSTRR